VQEAAEQAGRLLNRKRQIRVSVATQDSPAAAPWNDSVFLRACRRARVDYTPVWLMRQAGRYMPEYRAIRAQMSFLELCRNPQRCSEVMCIAVERLGVDAAIVFSDLLPILEPMGMELEFSADGGPQIHNPVRESGDVDRVIELEDADELYFVMEAVRQTRADLPSHLPLIGFAGAPFTLASYAIEGGASRTYLHTKTLMLRDRGAWHELMQRLARSVAIYLNAQIAAGAQAVQLFDSWVGCLGVDDYRQFVLPYVTEVVRNITPGVPVINFATGNPQLLPLLAEAELRRRAIDVLDQAAGRPGHIFNLGHGVLPQTPVDSARALVDVVHEHSART
jgi:uroporphyrinogen decarboxylase